MGWSESKVSLQKRGRKVIRAEEEENSEVLLIAATKFYLQHPGAAQALRSDHACPYQVCRCEQAAKADISIYQASHSVHVWLLFQTISIQYIRESLKSWFVKKLSIILLIQTLLAFGKTNKVYWPFAKHDLQMDLIHAWWILTFFSIFWWKSKMTTICSNFISQGAVKAWIIANCIDFIIEVLK